MTIELRWATVEAWEAPDFVPQFPEMATGRYVTILQYRVGSGEWKAVPHEWAP